MAAIDALALKLQKWLEDEVENSGPVDGEDYVFGVEFDGEYVFIKLEEG